MNPAQPQTATSSQPRSRLAGAVGSAWAAIMGVLPHVLHHVGPLAGAALLAGTTGTLLFGAATFLLTIPLLLRVRRRHNSWRVPAVLLAVFVGTWSISTWVVAPWVNEQFTTDSPAQHSNKQDEDHDEHVREGA